MQKQYSNHTYVFQSCLRLKSTVIMHAYVLVWDKRQRHNNRCIWCQTKGKSNRIKCKRRLTLQTKQWTPQQPIRLWMALTVGLKVTWRHHLPNQLLSATTQRWMLWYWICCCQQRPSDWLEEEVKVVCVYQWFIVQATKMFLILLSQALRCLFDKLDIFKINL